MCVHGWRNEALCPKLRLDVVCEPTESKRSSPKTVYWSCRLCVSRREVVEVIILSVRTRCVEHMISFEGKCCAMRNLLNLCARRLGILQ